MPQTAESPPPKTVMSSFARSVYEAKYAWRDDDGKVVEDWPDTALRVTTHVMGALGYSPGDEEFEKVRGYVTDRKFMPGGRYLYASGRGLAQVQNCLLLRAEDSREGWADLLAKSAMALQTGAGIGVDYSDIRPSGSTIGRTGGVASGPLALMRVVNEVGRGVMQGGARRSAIWAGLNWRHGDCERFIKMKDWSPEIRALKEQDFNFPAEMEQTNISVLLDDLFFEAYEDEGHEYHPLARRIYDLTIRQMMKTAEPGLSVDIGENAGETCRNACCELTSSDTDDVCNLGSINLARCESIDEMQDLVRYGTLFLLAGTVYSDLPYREVHEVREKNRRLGLGLMGVHEWLLERGYRYGPADELGEWLAVYATSTGVAAEWADLHGLSRPVKTRAIAPTGTISIVAEACSGLEPIFTVAYKRRVRQAQAEGGSKTSYQYVVDPSAQRLIEGGLDPDDIEDAYTLSYDVERRVAFQAWVQQYVDHAISSTINVYKPLEAPEAVEFGQMLYKYLPRLRGITAYPDGSRGGQPLTSVPYEVAIEHEGTVFEEEEGRCVGGTCGS